MTPRSRLSVSIVALVGAVAILLSGLALYGLAEAKFEETYEIARVTSEQVKVYVLQRVSSRAAVPPGANIEEATAAWRDAVRDDPQLNAYLVSTIAGSRSVVEILVAGESGALLATSNPGRGEEVAPPLPDLEAWTRQPAWSKLRQVFGPARDLELRVPLGVGGGETPVLTIRVIVSTALIRDAVTPRIQAIGLVALLCLAASAVLAWFIASFAGRPLERISEMIDMIAEGDTPSAPPPASEDYELASLQSKLALLGEQVRGASRSAHELRGNVEQMLERLQDAVFLFDPDNRLVLASKAAERFLALGRWEVIGRPLSEIFRDSTPLGALVQSASRLGQPLRDHLINVEQPGGSKLHMLVTVELLEDFPDRRRLGTIVTLCDAESRRQLESQLDASYRREAFGRLLQGVAHEIKNPLNSIYTHLQLLQMQLSGGPSEAKEEMEVISREIKTLDRMVVTLLDFTKPLELTFAGTDLVALTQEIGGLMRPLAAEKDVSVEVRHDLPEARIWADRTFLRQAIMNVTVNGVESMRGPGRVCLAVTSDERAVTLSISDEGPGIPEDVREKIFNLYFTTKGKRGSGIGLAMTYRIIQLHDAELDFDTEAGKGTTFRFRFPLPHDGSTAA